MTSENNSSLEPLLKYVVILICGIFTTWDSITTGIGLIDLLGFKGFATPQDFVRILIAIGLTFLVTSFMVATFKVLGNKDTSFVKYLLYILWGTAIIFDIYTSFFGNIKFIVEPGGIADEHQTIIAFVLTFFVCSSPLILSKFIFNDKK